MNPRVSRSSALASKATGFPIAKIAAKLAVGYTLDELRNDITRETPASFEPAIDYCVVKFPRWAFEKFPEADQTLTTQMKSVGEVMAIGRTFKEALQKAVRSLEQDRWGLTLDRPVADLDELRQKLRIPNADRCFAIGEAYRRGLGTREIHELTFIDPWFLDNIRQIVEHETVIATAGLGDVDVLRRAKQMGFSDVRLAQLTGATEDEVRHARARAGLKPVYKMVDTCAAEFVAHTPYLYSTYEEEDEAPADVSREGGDPGKRAQPHRPGHRVRLRVRARRLRPPRRGGRGDHGELQPGDGVDRLRHLRPPLLRAAHVRGRDERSWSGSGPAG